MFVYSNEQPWMGTYWWQTIRNDQQNKTIQQAQQQQRRETGQQQQQQRKKIDHKNVSLSTAILFDDEKSRANPWRCLAIKTRTEFKKIINKAL